MQYDITIQGGEVQADLQERSITGLVLPFNEVGRTNVGQFSVQAGAVALPPDPSVVSLNLDHDRYQPVGRATRLWETAAGIMGSFVVGRTPAGDQALADIAAGVRASLSAEFKTDITSDGRAINGSFAATALVKAGAFPSARVLAELADEPVTSSSAYSETYTDENGVTWRRESTTETETTRTDAGIETTSTTTVVESTTEEEQEATVAEQETVQAGAVPATIAASGAPAAVLASRMPDIQTIAGAIAAVKANRSDQQAVEVLAALADLTMEGANALTGPGVIQPNWMGLIRDGIPYVREYIDLCNHGSEIYAGGKKGYKLRRGTAAAPVDAPFDGTWPGNKQPIKSYQGFTTTHESVLNRWAIGEDIGREFYDLPGGLDAVLAFLTLLQEDYLIWSDELALSYIVATAGGPVAPTTAKYPTNYPAALGQLIQGILAVKKRKADGRRDTPTFAVANDEAFEQLVYAAGGEQNLPAFVSIALSTDGKGTVDTNVHVVNGDVGIEQTPAVLVGAKYAIDFDEPAGGLLEVDALDLARGGVDKAVHGYLQTFVKRPEALVLVGTADA